MTRFKHLLLFALASHFSALFLMAASSATPSQGALTPAVDRTIKVTEGTNISATVSPDQRTIVMDLQGILWSLPFAGGQAKALTDPFLEAARPHYSPKGDLVTFEAYQGGTFHIWVMKPDGTDFRQVTSGHGDDREPRFSPDGTRIAFSSDRAFKGSYDIWVVDVASGKLTQRTSNPADEYEPSWSPDSSEIAFVTGAGAAGTTIEATDASGGRRTVAKAPPGAHLDSPTWSPNGAQVAYTRLSGGKSELMLAGTRLGTADDVFPFGATWLPDNRLLYTANGKIQITALGGETTAVPFSAQFDLHRPAFRHKVFDLESSAARPVTGIVSPALSPDGKRIVFEALNQLWVMPVGSKPEAITDDKFYKEDPAWSPDGNRIAFSSDKSGTENIYVLDLATKQEKRISTSASLATVSAAWSPDGRMLAFQDQLGTTYTVSLDTGEQRKVIGPQFAPSKPSWAAGGAALSIGALKPYTRRFREGTSQILTVDLKTGALTYSEPAPFGSLSTRGEVGPVYSPDGSLMAFVMNSVLWVRPVDAAGIPTAPARQITSEVTDAPTWGDSKHLLYLSNGKPRIVQIDGSGAQTVPLELTWQDEETPRQTLIHAGRFWDGRGPSEQTDVDILVAGKRIQSITAHSESAQRDAAAKGVQFVDAAKWTAMPGLWEAHTHEWIEGKFYGDRLGRLWLAYGVTELQSQGDPVYRSLETREAFASGQRIGPRFFATGEAIDGERVYYNFMRPTISDAQLYLELSRARELHYDNLKTYVRLPHAMQKRVAEFGHDQMGVVTASHYMLPGLAYGVDGMTHISATSRFGFAYTRSAGGVTYNDVRSLFEAAGEYAISTTFESFPLYAEDPSMVDDVRLLTLNPAWDQNTLRVKRDLALGKHVVLPPGMHVFPGHISDILEGLQKEENTVADLLHHGGIILAGTDSPLDNVATALHLNLRAQVKYGLKPWEALQTATLLPAKAFGVANDLGTLEPGKLADLVLVSGDPLKNINDAANVQDVMKSGRLYSVGDLLAPFVEKSASAK